MAEGYISPEITALRQRAERAGEIPVAVGEIGMGLEDQLRTALAEHPEAVRQRGETAGLAETFFAAPDVARERYRDITDPFRRTRLVSQAGGSALRDFLAAGEALKSLTGGFETAIGGATRRLGTLGQIYGLRGEQAQRSYQNLLSEYVQKQQLDIARRQAASAAASAAASRAAASARLQWEKEQVARGETTLKLNAMGQVWKAIEDGSITTGDQIRQQLLGLGQKPDDKYFKDLYSKVEAPEEGGLSLAGLTGTRAGRGLAGFGLGTAAALGGSLLAAPFTGGLSIPIGMTLAAGGAGGLAGFLSGAPTGKPMIGAGVLQNLRSWLGQ